VRATILADASWCPHSHAGGWGYWIASDRGKRGGGGPLRTATTSTVAEMMAVVNAVKVALNAELVEQGDELLVQTDCLAAIDAFKGRRTCHDVDEQHVLQVYAAVLFAAPMHVAFRHVKGHTNRHTRPEARFGANRACDGRARHHMLAERARRGYNGSVPQD